MLDLVVHGWDMLSWLRPLLTWIRNLIRRIVDATVRVSSGGGYEIPDDRCCGLARMNRECYWAGRKSEYFCPEGYHKLWWYCCEGTQQVGCGECTESLQTCYQGNYQCSIWWYAETC